MGEWLLLFVDEVGLYDLIVVNCVLCGCFDVVDVLNVMCLWFVLGGLLLLVELCCGCFFDIVFGV